MRKLTFAVVVVAVVSFAAPAFAQSPIGVWKMNPAKSKYSPGPAPKSATVTTTATPGGGFRTINEQVPVSGPASKSDLTYKFDGKEVMVTGNPNADTQSYTSTDARHWTVVSKLKGKVTLTSKIEMAADGKSRVTTQTGVDSQGKAIHNVIWYDKQ